MLPEIKLIDLTQPARPAATVEDFRLARIDEYFRSTELTQNTQRAYKRSLSRFGAWTNRAWHEIKSQDIDRYKQYLKEQNLSAASICQELAALKSFFQWLTIKDYITKDPTLTLVKPKLKPPRSNELSDEQLTALEAALAKRGVHQIRDTAIFWVLWHGLRANEAISLNVEDYNGLGVNIAQAKRDSVGFVPLIGSARIALDRYLQWRKEQKFITEPQSPLFISHSARSKGERLSYRGLHSLISRLAENASLEGVHPHRLRHTIANKMAQAGMESLLARQITRHQSESAYERYSQNALRSKATELFLALFDEDSEPGTEEE